MKILMFGETGQVARAVIARARDAEVEALDRAAADLTRPADCAARVATTDADIVLNAAAYTDVDGAENDENMATVVNGVAPGVMAAAAGARGLPFLHISTDYVFDGRAGDPWREDAAPAPVNAYGRTKLAGERGVAAAGGRYAVLRTSWVFSAHGKNFVKTMLRAGATRDRLTVVDDQTGGPTPAAAIADALIVIARAFGAGRGRPGVYHFAGAPAVSRAGFARAIFAAADMPVDVMPIAAADWPTPARRPAQSDLDCSALETTYEIKRPDWTAGLKDVVDALKDRTHGP